MGAIDRFLTGSALAQQKVDDQGNPFPVVNAVPGVAIPDIVSLHSIEVDLAANTANQVLVAAPGAGKQIWVYGIIGGGGTGAGTITFEDEDDTEFTGDIPTGTGLMLHMVSELINWPLFKVPTNKALEADTATSSWDGILRYAIVNV